MVELAVELEKVLQADPLNSSEIKPLPSSEKGALDLLEEEVATSTKESTAVDTSSSTQGTSETIDVSDTSPKPEEANTSEKAPTEMATSDFSEVENDSMSESMQKLQELSTGELYFALAMGQTSDSDKISEIANWQSIFGTGEDSAILYHNVHNA
ncbi:MAG: hypothetical protein RLZZ430_534 [Cyanobacteriota bacterium]|jgi:hypothetical protein